ncbi:phage tail-collar fiber domain-containing protein [Fusobacterium necrophorum]|uniref:Phage tail fibre protein N-terminal domain-containing protein n=1 Tax=Fusobacterium necrophorum subsp. funduliforme Fnf 1007 TaxID=1161424 RepID=A0AAN4AU01_9FUSO|nr:phage tail protein [Fusobacterium necrophorum]EJU19043.1 hypothetical protein HMPREF1127_1762 [Fusobacterium necrophorum subsp. funduliforme Fnf 1007]
MKFNGLTNEGKAYLAKIKTNHGTIEFKSMKFGDGSLLSYENPETFRRLKNQKSEKEILDKVSSGDTITLNSVVDNTALKNGYYLREIGIFVSDQGREILFFYMNDGDETSFVPPETDGPYKSEIGINLVISNVESIVVNNEVPDLYVTKAFVERKLKEKQDVIEWKSGGNLEKTNLTENNSNKLFTAKGALDLFNKLTSLIAEKEPKISKLSGFNLSKSDADDLDSSTTLATSKAVKKVKDALERLNLSWNNITGKPNFGLKSGEFMEGHRLAESLGVKEYGGLISSSGQKKEGNAYYDSNTKNMFYCKETNSYTSANSSYFEPFDNKELLNRLNNLSKRKEVLLWSTNKYGGVDQETCTLSRPYTDFDEIVFVTVPSDYTSEWRILTTNIIINKGYIAYAYGNLTWKFTSSTRVWFDGSHQWLGKIYGIKY